MSSIVSTHAERTMEDWPNMIGVPMFICRISRMVGLGGMAAFMPFLYGFGHIVAEEGTSTGVLVQAVMSGVQAHYICKNFGLQ